MYKNKNKVCSIPSHERLIYAGLEIKITVIMEDIWARLEIKITIREGIWCNGCDCVAALVHTLGPQQSCVGVGAIGPGQSWASMGDSEGYYYERG